MAGKRANVSIGDDSFMADGECRRTVHRVVETPTGPVETEERVVQPEAFFAEDGRSLADKMLVVEARMACSRCAVQVECLEWALAAREEHGIWGGTDREQRAVILKRRAKMRRRVAV